MPTNTSEAASGGEEDRGTLLYSALGKIGFQIGKADNLADRLIWQATAHVVRQAILADRAAVPAAPVGGEGSRTGALRDALITFLSDRFFLSPGQCGGHVDALMAEFDVRMKDDANPAMRDAVVCRLQGLATHLFAMGQPGSASIADEAAEIIAPLIARATAAEATLREREAEIERLRVALGEIALQHEAEWMGEDYVLPGERPGWRRRPTKVALIAIAALTQPATPATDEATR